MYLPETSGVPTDQTFQEVPTRKTMTHSMISHRTVHGTVHGTVVEDDAA